MPASLPAEALRLSLPPVTRRRLRPLAAVRRRTGRPGPPRASPLPAMGYEAAWKRPGRPGRGPSVNRRPPPRPAADWLERRPAGGPWTECARYDARTQPIETARRPRAAAPRRPALADGVRTRPERAPAAPWLAAPGCRESGRGRGAQGSAEALTPEPRPSWVRALEGGGQRPPPS